LWFRKTIIVLRPSEETSMDVEVWLRGLGLEQYEALFRENDLDAEVLSDLTDGDLAKIGVSLGHRKRLLKAVAALAGPPPALPPASTPVPPVSPPHAAERRQLTVMFCDLVGSTALSARLDPEDMREVIRAYQDACSGAIAGYDGFVAKFMGDGVLAYFGFPRAHEEDAERAVRAGLDIAAVVAKLETPAKDKLKVRIGVATGIVVVGDLVGQGPAQEQAVVGDTPNLAARLQALAEPGSVVIAESTKRLLGGAFELKALEPQVLKGFDAPVPAWAALREAENVSRFEASRSQGLMPLIGREHEVALLMNRWRDVKAGEGQVVLLSGEAGIGKSRILAALREGIGSKKHLTMRYQCSPHHVNDAFYPIVSQIWHAAGFVSGEPPSVRLDKLEAMIARSELEAKEITPYLAALLSIPFEGRYPPIEMGPSDQKERTIAVLIDLFVGLTKDAPVLALLEDAHWIDPTSLDLFGRLVDRLSSLHALLVITFRPEFVAPWLRRAHVTSLPLNRFGRCQALAMIERVAGGMALPSEVTEQIVAKTDGVPLFVEELTKTVLESGLVREEGGTYVLASTLTPLAIPSTLQDSLMARLDRLAAVKEIAQIGAAIGREFSYHLLEAVSPIQGPALQDALSRLMAAELIHARGAPPEATYVFKHALVQDTAHASLLRSRRQRIHADIARALEERFVDQIEAAPAIVAHHYTEAGIMKLAVRYWIMAADLALARSTHVEAERFIDAGLMLIPHLAEGSERQASEVSLLVARVNAFLVLKGFTAPETVNALTEAKRFLDAGVGTDLERFSVLYILCLVHYNSSRLASALSLAREIVGVADQQSENIYRIVGYRLLGTILVTMGENVEALVKLEHAERYREPRRDKLLSYRFGIDPGLAVLCYKQIALTCLGRLSLAARVREQVQSELSNHGHALTVAQGNYLTLVLPETVFGDFQASENHAAELIAFCTEKKLEQFSRLCRVFYAFARAAREVSKENVAELRAAIEAQHRSGGLVMNSAIMSFLVEALLAAGDVTGAEAALQEGFDFVEQSGERTWLAELHRLDGQVALKRPEPDSTRAEACFLRAIEIARRQEAPLLELRPATALARLWRETTSPNDPRTLLEPILAAIEGGETTRYVRDARALLAELD
jgi:class 3 adenylate cyclase